ncbi:predicted protein [Arabidopsis lyrata subsp. lyrata]|uniref:Predicted protein n=1 Tax=Arabidopsis lyrata subsp. lyrata TaxID=81972 RepID=D7MKE9_ARALL|nr:predicted protein [Arabidopsis lyrata subsp. lyrata]
MESKKAKLATKKISEYLRTSRGSLDPIPHDLIPDILKKLHVKNPSKIHLHIQTICIDYSQQRFQEIVIDQVLYSSTKSHLHI